MLLKFDRPKHIYIVSREYGLGWYLRRFTGLLNKHYLYADGVNDHDFWLEAIDALPKNPGGKVEALEGEFVLGGAITGAKTNVTLAGQGRSTVLSFASTTAAHAIIVGGDGWQIKDLAIDCANQTGSYNSIYANGNSDGLIRDVKIKDAARMGIRLVDYATGSSGWRILHSNFEDSGYPHIFVGGKMSDITIDDCHFGTTSTDPLVSITPDGEGDGALHNAKVQNCTFDGGSGYPTLHFDGGCYDVSSINNHFKTPDNTSLRFSQSFRCVAIGNIFEDSGYCNISVYGSDFVDITGGNQFTGSKDCAVEIVPFLAGRDSHFVGVTDNIFYNCGKSENVLGANLAAVHIGGDAEDIDISHNIMVEDRGTKYFKKGVNFGGAGTIKRVTIDNNKLVGVETNLVHIAASRGGDDSKITNNEIYGAAVGVHLDDGDDIMLGGNRYIGCTTPIDINNAAVVRCQIQGNNWEGCTNDPSIGSATTPRIHANIDKNGAWWSTDDL